MIPTQEQLNDYFKKIDESNAAFEAATWAEKRVMIAKDVLNQLRLGRIRPENTYFSPSRPDGGGSDRNFREIVSPSDERELKSMLRSVPVCSVCGIGALFVAAVERIDALKIRDFGDDRSDLTYYLDSNGLFTESELDEVEAFFENWIRATDHPLYRQNRWDETGNGTKVRMQRIVDAILETNGEKTLTVGLLLSAPPKLQKL